MKTYLKVVLTLFSLMLLSITLSAQDNRSLTKTYDFSGVRTGEQQYFIQHTQLINYSPDGTRTGTDELKMYLTCLPKSGNNKAVRTYTCFKFQIRHSGGEWLSIPALNNWTYSFDGSLPGMDEKGQVFGIDHARFDGLTDNLNNPVDPALSYLIYNSFIDFHGFSDVFAEPLSYGTSVKDLANIGDRIVHAAANSEPPVNLGSNIEKGSYFRNGNVTLEFLGLSNVNNSDCAMINYDSGESSYRMLMKMPPDMNIETVGSSHYQGIIYKNLETNWIEKITMNEFVLSETRLPMPPNKINSATERILNTNNVTKEEFVKSLEL